MKYENLKSLLSAIEDVPSFFGVDLVNPNQRGIIGTTPLSVVITWEDVEAVRMLLDAGADVNAEIEFGHTALHYAVMQDNLEIAWCLVDGGALLDVRDYFGMTPLDWARSKGNPDMLWLLTKKNSS